MHPKLEKAIENVKWFRKTRFFRNGLPFLTFMIGGSYAFTIVQDIKFDAQRDKQQSTPIRYKGKEIDISEFTKDLNLEEELKKIQEANAEIGEYKNVRGPRYWEDNQDWERAREIQEKRLRQFIEHNKSVKGKT